MHYSVPQGSVFGPILSIFYLLALYHLMQSLTEISFYADDIHLLMYFKPHSLYILLVIRGNIESFKNWLNQHLLQINKEKTEILICAQGKCIPSITAHLGPLTAYIKLSIRKVWVTFQTSCLLEWFYLCPKWKWLSIILFNLGPTNVILYLLHEGSVEQLLLTRCSKFSMLLQFSFPYTCFLWSTGSNIKYLSGHKRLYMVLFQHSVHHKY